VAKALVITEKPSVARDIAAALGGFNEHEGYWESDAHVLTFAVGHLFELLEPEEIDEKFKRWTLDVLPILPDSFQLKKKKGQTDRIRVIEKLVNRDDVDRLINACDAGREGELIFREIVSFLGVRKPIQRLWLQSMTQDAIRDGFAHLMPGKQLEGLAQAAECRAYSDWLIGMNATRALTKRLKSRKETRAWSAGRVQTPTLALLVEKEFEVLAHVPRPFWRVTATFAAADHTYTAAWFDPAFAESEDAERRDDRIFDRARAEAIVAAARANGALAGETRKPSRESAPPLFDLTSLQREGNRRFGWSARRTLGAAQACYEAYKVLTYPRTDSRCLPSDYRASVDEVLRKLSAARGEGVADYAAGAQRLLRDGLLNQERVFDDAGVSDHFAIVPTGVLPRADMRGDARRLYDLVARRFLGAFHGPALWERVERTTVASGESFRTRARALMEPGWRAVLPAGEDEEGAGPLPALAAGRDEASDVAVRVQAVLSQQEETKPPARITEGRLLSLMENAGKELDDENLAAVMHEKGIGTPATRAEIIENLIGKGYALRQGKSLRPTVKGIRLIDTLKRIHEDRLASASLTGEIEYHLREVEHGRRTASDFLDEMREYASEIVDRAKNFEYDELYAQEADLGPCPKCGRPVIEMAWFYRCKPDPKAAEGEDCSMRFWKDTSGRYLDRTAVAALLRDGRTPVLDGFTARSGRTYRAHLEVDHDDWRLQVHPAGWNEEAAIETPEYEVNTEPLGKCPFGGEECQVIETPTHFACTSWVADAEAQAAFRAAKKAAREAGQPPPEKPEKPDHALFVFPRTVCKREITRDEALVYLRDGKTELLQDFTSRHGRPFSAQLVLKDTGRHGFEFPPRGNQKKAEGEGAEAGAADAAAAGARAPKAAGGAKRGKRAKAAGVAGAAPEAAHAVAASGAAPAEGIAGKPPRGGRRFAKKFDPGTTRVVRAKKKGASPRKAAAAKSAKPSAKKKAVVPAGS
jgi:DNA topoisomerase-3